MTPQYWIGDSCTGSSLHAHQYHAPTAKARARYMRQTRERYTAKHRLIKSSHVWPFVHAVIHDLDRPWLKKGSCWGVDPLVIPILDCLNNHGINTISSCQGSDRFTPHILLACDYESAMRAKTLVEHYNDSNRPFNHPLFTVERMRPKQGGQGWDIHFHDTIALIAWNVAHGVSLTDQLKAPTWWDGKVASAEDIQPLL